MITSLILASQLTVFCEEQRDFADKVMTYRQRNHPISMVMSIAEGDTTRQLVIVMAYKEPLEESDIMKMEAGFKFGDEIFNMCMRGSHETNP